MKIIYNKLIPFKGFYAISLFGLLFVRDEKGERNLFPRLLSIMKQSTTTNKRRCFLFSSSYGISLNG